MIRPPLAGLVLALLATLGAGACRNNETPAAPPRSPAPPSDSLSPPAASALRAATARYHCDGIDLTVLYDADHVTVQAPGREYTLPQVQAASGAKFQSDKALFWNKGDQALVEIDGRPYTNCREQLPSDAPPAP